MVPLRRLTWVSGTFRAHLLAARLRSEGIDVELRGAVLAPYGLTVGSMARVDLWVPEDQLEDASLVLLAGEIDQVLAAPSDWGHAGAERRATPRWPLWVASLLLVTAACPPVLALLD